MQILGVRIDELTKQQALEKAREFLCPDFAASSAEALAATEATSGKAHKIFTPNPEMLVDAQKDPDFKTVLNGGDMNLCDGFGLWIVASVIARSEGRATRQSKSSMTRIPGVDFMLDLCALAEKEGKSVYLLGSGSDEVVKKTAQVLQERFPMLRIVGYDSGSLITDHGSLFYDKEENESVVYDIIIKAPDILFVAFGHGKQEKWIAENLRDLPSVKIAMGVGGAFDFISGKVKRAPKIMRKMGLEWMWRLILQPCRVGRILKATIIFLFMFYRTQISRITRIRQDHG